jgi:hypothetical protein
VEKSGDVEKKRGFFGFGLAMCSAVTGMVTSGSISLASEASNSSKGFFLGRAVIFLLGSRSIAVERCKMHGRRDAMTEESDVQECRQVAVSSQQSAVRCVPEIPALFLSFLFFSFHPANEALRLVWPCSSACD